MASRTLSVVIAGDSSGARRAFGEVDGGLNSLQQKLRTTGQKMQQFGRSLTFGVTLPIVGAMALATKAAADEQQEIAKLNAVLKNSAAFTDISTAAVERQVTAWQNATGFADGELRPALSNLVVAGMDWTKAQTTLATAMDIATAKGLPLETVTKALARAYMGNTTALGRLGIQTKDAEGNMLSFDQIMQNAASTMGGSTAKAADTAAGRMKILRARFADAFEELGTNLLPILEKVIGAFSGMLEKFNNLSPGWQQFILAAGGAVAILGPLLMLLGSLMTVLAAVSLPVLAVAAAIGILVAGAVALYLKWDEVWTWMKDHPAIAALILLMTGPITIPIIALVGLIRWLQANWEDVWPKIRGAVEIAWAILEPILGFLDGVLRGIADAVVWLAGVAQGYFRAFSDAVQTMWNAVDGPLNWIWDRLENIASAARAVKNALSSVWDATGFGGNSIDDVMSMAEQGRRASGGPVSAGQLYRVNENGTEYFRPLMPGNIVPLGGGGGGPSIIVNVHGSVITERSLDEVVATSMTRWNRLNGR